MTPEERELLVEQVASAWRPRLPGGGARSHPAWHDLDADGRREAFEATRVARLLESALDREGLSSTGRVVMAAIRRGARHD
jgi:hypothetical protein